LKVLLVDDSKVTQLVLTEALENQGYEVVSVKSGEEAMEYLGLDGGAGTADEIDLIMMGLVLKSMTGLEATEKLKKSELTKDIPICIVTAKHDDKTLKGSFDAGANDFVNKNFNKVELVARVRSLLKLKEETDKRKAFAHQLEEANAILKRLSSVDGLTQIPNRRSFDEFLEREWKRCLREKKPLSVALTDIDCFKFYNDNYGHQPGDDTLKAVAQALEKSLTRPGDFAARYGGEEFTLVMPNTDRAGAEKVAEAGRAAVEALQITHDFNLASVKKVTLSLGVATMIPTEDKVAKDLVELADLALYEAKEGGRNQCRFREG